MRPHRPSAFLFVVTGLCPDGWWTSNLTISLGGLISAGCQPPAYLPVAPVRWVLTRRPLAGTNKA